MQLLPVFFIVLVVVLATLFFVYRDKLIGPVIDSSVTQITTGTELYIINAELYRDKKPAYLSMTASGTLQAHLTWLDSPDLSSVWVWEQNVSECFSLDSISGLGCSGGYYNDKTFVYDCTKCSGNGSQFCSACSDGLDKTPYTSLSIKNKKYQTYLSAITFGLVGGNVIAFSPVSTVSRLWTESRNPANSPSSLFDTSVVFKNVPSKGPGVYYMSNALYPPDGPMSSTTQRADDSVYYLSFLPPN